MRLPLRQIAAIGAVTLLVVALAGYSVWQSRLSIQREAAAHAADLDKVLERYVYVAIHESDLALQLSAEEYLRLTAAGRPVDVKAYSAFLESMRRRLPQLINLRATDASGKVTFGAGLDPANPVNLADRDHFKRARDASGLSIAAPVLTRISKQWALPVGRRLEDRSGQFNGVVYASIAVEHFSKLFASLAAGEHQAVILFDADTNIYIRDPEPKGPGSAIGLKIGSPQFKALWQQGNKSAIYSAQSTTDGIWRTYSYRQVGDYPLYIMVGLADEDYLQPWRLQAGITAAFLLAFLLVAAILLRSLGRSLAGQRRAETALQAKMQELSIILANSSVGVSLVRNRQQIWANRRMEELFGYAAADMANQSTRMFYTCQEAYERLGQQAYPLLASGQIYKADLEMRHRDGHPIWMNVAGQAVSPQDPAAGSIWVFEDITERKAAEAQLKQTQDRLALALAGSNLAMVDWDVSRDHLVLGEGWTKLLGWPAEALPATQAALLGLVQPDDAAAAGAALQRYLQGESRLLEAEVRMRHRDGRWVWVHARGMVVERDAGGRPLRLTGTAMDVSERKEAEAEIARLSQRNELLLNSAGEGIYGVDLQGRCTFINPAALAMLGFGREEVLGQNQHALFHFKHPDGRSYAESECPVFRTLRDGIRRELEDTFLRKGGEPFPVQLTVTPMLENDRLIGAEVVFQDVARRKEMEAELTRLATTDPLTGIANRRRFLDQLEMELARIKRFGRPAALLMLDLDRFKEVNDTYGHAVGDAVLRHFAELGQQRLRRIDLFGRLGGEEFGILLPGTASAGARQFAERLRAEIAAAPAPTAKGAIAVTVSIGIAEFDPADPASESILARADVALYRAKGGGRNRVEVS